MDRGDQLALLPLADAEAAALLTSVPAERRAECWWLVLRDGTLLPGDAGGGVALLREMRRTRLLGRLLTALRLSIIVDVLDKGLARSRKRIGRYVPEGDPPRRFP